MRSSGWTLIQQDWYLYKWRILGHRHYETRSEDTGRRWLCTSQVEKPQKKSTLSLTDLTLLNYRTLRNKFLLYKPLTSLLYSITSALTKKYNHYQHMCKYTYFCVYVSENEQFFCTGKLHSWRYGSYLCIKRSKKNRY